MDGIPVLLIVVYSIGAILHLGVLIYQKASWGRYVAALLVFPVIGAMAGVAGIIFILAMALSITIRYAVTGDHPWKEV